MQGGHLENSFAVTVERLLHEILCEALRINFTYEDFVDAVISAYGFKPKKVAHARVVNKTETLIESIHKQVIKRRRFEFDAVDLLKNLISGRQMIARAYLIDDLGLAEIYALSKCFGYSNLSLKVIINREGNTQTFKNFFGVDYMNQLSRLLGAQLITGQDRLVHEIFGKWVKCDELLKAMGRLLPTNLLKIVDRVPAILISDHGYDIECAGEYYRLCHGYECREALLSLICPIILISGQSS